MDASIKLLLPDREYVLDKPNIHKAADFNKIGTGEHRRAPQPSHGPDFNNPVEHAHSILQEAFQERLTILTEPRSPEFYQRLLRQVFKEVVTKEVVLKDVLKLQELYEIVSKPISEGGVAGGWPPAQYR